MFKVKLKLPKFLGVLLIVCFTFFTAYAANSQTPSLAQYKSTISTRETSKYKLASDVLAEMGIAERYDLHFDHLMGTLIGNGKDSKLYARFRKMFVEEIGWRHFKDAYIARLEADFSENELKELLNLSKQPALKKLLRSEVKAYADTSAQRFKLGFELWDNYNSGKINLPPE